MGRVRAPDDGESSAPAPEGDRSLPHGSVGYSMALRNVGSSAKAKPEPSKYRQTSDDSMVNDVDADESMGGEPSADRPSEDAPEPYLSGGQQRMYRTSLSPTGTCQTLQGRRCPR